MSDGATHINYNNVIRDLRILLKKYKELQCKFKIYASNLEKLTNKESDEAFEKLSNEIKETKEKIENILELLDIQYNARGHDIVIENQDLFSTLLLSFKPKKETVKKVLKEVEKLLKDSEITFEGEIRYYIKSTQDGVEVLSEEEFDIDEFSDDLINNLEIDAHYKYWGSSKTGIVYIKPLLADYRELNPIDYDVIKNEVFRKHPAVTAVKLNLTTLETLTLDEVMSNLSKYLHKPVKIKGTLTSLSTTTKNILWRARVLKKEGEEVIYNFPVQPKLFDLENSKKLRVKYNDEDNISLGFIEFTITANELSIDAITYSYHLQKLKENLGAELEFWGIIYPVFENPSSLEQELIFFVTDIKTPDEERAVLSQEREKEIEEKLQKFKDGKELLEWMIDNYAPRIRYKEKGDFTWRMKLTHLILAQNSWLNNEEMIHALLLSRPGVGKSTLALYYLKHIAKRLKYADRQRMTRAGLLGGFDQQSKETRVGVLKSADKGVMVIDEVDKFDEIDKSEKTVLTALNGVLQHGLVSITIGNQSRSLQYQTRPNLLLLGNYNEKELQDILETFSDRNAIDREKSEFIAKEMLKITNHISTLDRFVILDSDVFEYTKTNEDGLEDEIDSIIESKKESTSLEPTTEELIALQEIRDIMIYNANRIDRKKLLDTIKNYKEEISKFLKDVKERSEKNRLIHNLIHLITVISVLKGEQKVSIDTVKTAFMLAGTSQKYKRYWSKREEELEEFVKDFIEEDVIRELPSEGVEIETIRRKFKDAVRANKFTTEEQKQLEKLFEKKLLDFASSNLIKKEGSTVKVGKKRLEEALYKLLENYDKFAVKRKSTTKFYYDLQKLSKELGVSTDITKKLLGLISKDEITRTSIMIDGKKKDVYLVDVDLERRTEMLNNEAYKTLPLTLFT